MATWLTTVSENYFSGKPYRRYSLTLLVFMTSYWAASAQFNCAPYEPALNATVTNVSCNGAANGSISLAPTGGFAPYSYQWSNGATTQNLTGLAPGSYSVTVTNGLCQTFGVELVNNSGFEDGNINFSSSYNYCNTAGCLQPEGNYAIGGNPNFYHGNFFGSPNSGNNFLMVNGIGSPNTSVWCQTITVQPNTVYNFSTWVTSLNASSPANLQFSINGVTIGNIFQAPATLNVWAQFFAVWNSGSNTTASICVVNQNTTASGNDFGLDNISFMECVTCSTTQTFTITQPAPLAITPGTVTPVSCYAQNNGSATVNVTGGTAPYNIVWTGGQTGTTATNLSPGSYMVLVTDARGCTQSTNIVITEPPVLTSPAVSTGNHNGQPISCNGSTDGSATVTPAGGTPPYTYAWSNGATTPSVTGLGAGTYTVTVTDARGCNSNGSVTITAPPVLSAATAVSDIVNCNGNTDGSITATPTGGTAPYTYLWSNGSTSQTAAGVGAGTYNVTITDANGCTATSTITLTQPATLGTTASVVSDYNGEDLSCNGSAGGTPDGIITATPTGGTAPYTYSWGNGAPTQTVNNVGAGTYTVTVTDANGCAATATVSVSEPPPLTSNGTVTSDYNGQDVSCNGSTDGTISVTPGGGTAPYTYSWSTGATTQTVGNVGAGTYNVTITDANGCTSTATVTVTEPAFALAATAQVTSNYNGQHVSCNGSTDGSISTTPAGGTAPYTYLWSNGTTTQNVTGLGAGTYNVTVTDANGCTATASVTVNQPAVLATTSTVVSNYNGEDLSCNGSAGGTPDGIIAATPTGGTGPYTYLWSNGGATQTVNGVGAGVYNVTVTDANGCTATSAVTVSEPPVLSSNGSVASDYNGQDVSCNGSTDGTITVTPGGGTAPYTYIWNNGAVTQTVNNVGAGTYNVTITDANGCTATSSVTVTEPAFALAATAQVTSNYNGQHVSCNGSTDGSIGTTPAGGTAPYTYAWSNGAATQTVTGVGAGTYTVTVTDVNGCTATATVTVNQPAALTSLASVTSNHNGQDISCNGSSNGTPDGSMTVIGSGGTGSYTYLWSNGSTAQSPTGIGAGTYTATVTDMNGCNTTASVTLTEPPVLTSSTNVTSNYNGQQIACNGGTNGSASVTPAGGTAPYSYLWSNGSTAQAPTGLGAGTYGVTITDVNGCTSASSVTLTQPTAVQSAAVVTQVLCFGNSTGAINLTPSGGVGPYTYVWNNGSANEDINTLPAGTYNVTITDANGCTATVSQTVTQPAQSVGGVLLINNVSCYNGTDGSIQVNASGGAGTYTYAWSNGATGALNTGISQGTYSVTVTDGNGCNFSASGIVQQPLAPISVSGVATDALCFGGNSGSIDLSVTGGTPGYTYAWSNGSVNQDINALSAGTYQVTVTDSKGCTDATYSVAVGQPQAALAVTGDPTHVKCFGESDGAVNITVTGGTQPYAYAWSNGSTGEDIQNLPTGTYSVNITDANGCQYNAYSAFINQATAPLAIVGVVDNIDCFGGVNGGVNLTVSGGEPGYTYNWSNGFNTQNISELGVGTYTVTVVDGRGCDKDALFNVNEPPQMFINGDVQDNLCYGRSDGSINLTITGGVPGYQFMWNFGSPAEDVANLGPGSYTVSVTDANGCNGVAGFTIFEAVPMSIAVDSLHQIFIGDEVMLTAYVSGGTGSYSYQWTPEESLSCPTCQSTMAAPLANTNYIVTATDGNNCPISDITHVIVNQDIFIPNTFTPNGNGTNDTFAPVVRQAKELTYSIFNRWGEKIFSSNDENAGWDGNLNGHPVKVDVYVYHVKVLFYNGIEKTYRGNVTVLR